MSCNKRHCCDNPQQGVLGSKHTIVIETDDSIEAINGKIIAITDKGVYYSSNKGISWISRNSSSQAKTFIAIQDAGRELLAQTSDGHLYYSTNEGISWMRRR